MKQKKIYALYRGDKGVTCYSQYYDKYTREIWHVAAVSAKQAYYLANNDIWYDGKGVGIIEATGPNVADPWVGWRENVYPDPQYKHGQKVKD